MQWQGWLTLALTFATLLTLSLTRLRPALVMLVAAGVLILSGVLPVAEALAGFANPGTMTVALMFVVAAGVHNSGGIDLLVEKVLGRPASLRSALLRVSLPVTLLSAFLNNTPVVATMIPAMRLWARKIGVAPSRLMIPLSYSAILGGTVTLIGTSTNLVVNGQYKVLTGTDGFGLFAITAIGLPVALAGLCFMWLFFPRWLPERSDESMFSSLREFTLEVTVAANGPLVGKSVAKAGLRHLQRIYLVDIIRDGHVISAVSPEEILGGGDRLVFVGDTEAIADLLRVNGLRASTDSDPHPVDPGNPERRLVEVVVSPRCEAIGQAIRDVRFRSRYGAAVLAVARGGERVEGHLGSISLAAGDTLLLEGPPDVINRLRNVRDFLLTTELDIEPPRHEKAWLSWGILLLLLVLVTTEVLSMLEGAMVGAGLMLAAGCCSVTQAGKSIDMGVLVTIAASLALGAALQVTGVAAVIAALITDTGIQSPWLLLALVYLVVSLLTEVITNNAAAVLALPVALEVGRLAGIDAEPLVFAVMMAASASFATPLGYQTNLMVYGPGNYRFSDFLRVGVPMNLFVGVVTVGVISWRYGLW
jgi:di/tricarboxylate transporter